VKLLAYCGFLEGPQLSLPATGVNGATLDVMNDGELRLLWSGVDWPLNPSAMQRNAVEFHEVVTHMFRQGAVVPFRLLSMFDDVHSLSSLITQHRADFVADLERLRNFVQMECVIFFAPRREDANAESGKAYLRQKAEMLHAVESYVADVRAALAGISADFRTREVKLGSRIFALVERGREQQFRELVQAVPVPQRLLRRVGGPWPAAEFLSAQVKAPKPVEAG
jgi:hypothetical protein